MFTCIPQWAAPVALLDIMLNVWPSRLSYHKLLPRTILDGIMDLLKCSLKWAIMHVPVPTQFQHVPTPISHCSTCLLIILALCLGPAPPNPPQAAAPPLSLSLSRFFCLCPNLQYSSYGLQVCQIVKRHNTYLFPTSEAWLVASACSSPK